MLQTLLGQSFLYAVSPDGRSIAYWDVPRNGPARTLWVLEPATSAPRQLLTLPDAEMAATSTGGGVVWSNDSKGLLIGVSSRDYVPGPPDQANVYTTLRQVDVASGSVREIVRRAPGLPFYPLAWDRLHGISVAAQWGGGGFVASYVVARDGAIATPPGLPRVTIHPTGMRASPDAARIAMFTFFAEQSRAVWVWPLEDPAQVTRLDVSGNDVVVAMRWRNEREIVVSLAQTADLLGGTRLEVWPLVGPRRVVLNAAHRLDAVRPDGTAAITSLGLVDLDTGAIAKIPDLNGGASASIFLR